MLSTLCLILTITVGTLECANFKAIEQQPRLTNFFCPEQTYDSYCCEASEVTKSVCQGECKSAKKIHSANVFIKGGDSCYKCRCIESSQNSKKSFYVIGKGMGNGGTLVEYLNSYSCKSSFFERFHAVSDITEEQVFPVGFAAAKVQVLANENHDEKLSDLMTELARDKSGLLVQITPEQYEGRQEAIAYFRFKVDPKMDKEKLATYFLENKIPIVITEIDVIQRAAFEKVFTQLDLEDADNLKFVVQISFIDFTVDHSASHELAVAIGKLTRQPPSILSPKAKVIRTMVALDLQMFPNQESSIQTYIGQLEEYAVQHKHIVTAVTNIERIPHHAVVTLSVYAETETIDEEGKINGKPVRQLLNEIARDPELFSEVLKFEIQFIDKCFGINEGEIYPWNPNVFVKPDIDIDSTFGKTLEDHYSLYYVLRRERKSFSPFYVKNSADFAFEKVFVREQIVSAAMLIPDNHKWKYLLQESDNGQKFMKNLKEVLPNKREPTPADIVYHALLGDGGDRAEILGMVTSNRFNRYDRYDEGEECGTSKNGAAVIWGDLKVSTFAANGEKSLFNPKV